MQPLRGFVGGDFVLIYIIWIVCFLAFVEPRHGTALQRVRKSSNLDIEIRAMARIYKKSCTNVDNMLLSFILDQYSLAFFMSPRPA